MMSRIDIMDKMATQGLCAMMISICELLVPAVCQPLVLRSAVVQLYRSPTSPGAGKGVSGGAMTV